MPKRKFYTNEDVARWIKNGGHRVEFHREQLATKLTEQRRDQCLSGLASSLESEGLICVTQGEFATAIERFRESGEVYCAMYERHQRGEGREMEPGYFQHLLVAYVTCDEELIARFSDYYDPTTDGPAESHFLGKAVKCIALGDMDGAREALAQKRPKFERQFMGYADCLQAIVDGDPQAFAAAMDVAADHWAKWASRSMKGQHPAVCFIQGVGLVRLAEKAFGRQLNISNEHMPAELLA